MIRARPAFWALVAAASLALSLVVVVRQPIPDPDGAVFLEAAEYFAASDWAAGRSVSPWPLYPWLIGVVRRLGVPAYPAAQIVNALFDASITLLFLDLVRRLGNGDRVLMRLAAGLIVLSPPLVQLRALLIPDHGFLACYLLVLDLLVWDLASPSRRKKIGMAAAVAAAGLFRLEAFVLFALIPGFHLFSRLSWERQRRAILAGCLGACALLPVGYYFKHGLVQVAFDLARPERVPSLATVFETVALRIQMLRDWTPGSAWHAYVGMILGVAVLGAIRHGIGIPLFLLSVSGFARPVRERHVLALRLVAWFSAGQVLVVVAHLFISLLMDLRLVLSVALLATVATACVLREMIRAWPRLPGGRSRARWALPAVGAALLVSFAVSVPGNPPVHLRDAGQWVRANLSPAETVLTNDVRILHYAGRLRIDAPSVADPRAGHLDPATGWAKHSVLILDVPEGSGLDRKLRDHFLRPPDAAFGRGPSRVLVFRTRKPR